MTATKPRAIETPTWKEHAALAALPSLLLPKCFACLHLYTSLVAWTFGTQVELCGDAPISWTNLIAESLLIIACLCSLRLITQSLITCSNDCRTYARCP